MSDSISEELPWTAITTQPDDARGLSDPERDKLIITATQVDGKWIIRSRYGDDFWQLNGFPNNVPTNKRQINFGTVPPAFRAAMKAIFYRYLRRGRSGADRPRGATVYDFFNGSLPFLRHLDALKLDRFGAATPTIAATYVAACKAHVQIHKGKPLSKRALQVRYLAVETLYELSQYIDDKIPQHPWPGTSPKTMAGRIGITNGGKTPLIPDDVFCTLFREAHKQVERGKSLLDLRDGLDSIAAENVGQKTFDVIRSKNRYLDAMGWEGDLRALTKSLLDLRTASYIVLASTSGCRNHELANLLTGAHRRTEDDDGTIYHWMRSTSEKTD